MSLTSIRLRELVWRQYVYKLTSNTVAIKSLMMDQNKGGMANAFNEG
ncbi:hypothetical protein [Jeotgalibacillus marinus]|uniref:Uncharacterized protein n=1 Tax=Jeotgalibacillus marinus TaxID=86667 RepID=A0ABV3Q747_9BACL